MLTTTIGQFIILLKDKVKGKVVADNKASRREGLKGVEEQLHAFLTSALDSGEQSDSHPKRFVSHETASGSHQTESFVGPRHGLGAVTRKNSYPCR
jgi:hypothetical protein